MTPKEPAMSFTPDQLAEYATTLILEHARDVQFLSIFEMAEEHTEAGEISDGDAKRVLKLISTATISVEFPAVQADVSAEVAA